MRTLKACCLIGCLLLFGAACGSKTETPAANVPAPAAESTPVPSPVDELAKAREIYGNVCSNCHGDKGDGGRVEFEGKKLRVPSLKKGHALTHSDEEFLKQISGGGDGMPGFKDRLKPEEMDALVKLVRKEIQAGIAPAASPAHAGH